MRITDQMLVDQTVQNLWANETRLENVQNQLTTGKKLSQISDNPEDGSVALTIRAGIAQTNQFLRNVDAAKAWLSTTDSALGGVDQSVLRAQELAVQGANDTLSASDRQGMAQEVDALIGQVVQLGNSTYAGSYLFAGAQTTSAPFSYSGGTVTYNSNDPVSAIAPLIRQIGPDARVQVNTVGHDPTTGQALFDTVFAALTTLKQALQTNDTSAIQSSITALQDAQQQVVQERESVGARINEVTTAGTQLTNVQAQLSMTQANLEDADMIQAATDYAQADIVRRAGMSAAAKTLPPSLFDYLA
jgi:flagellar hook-associated protein 3 FlgL